MGRNMSEGKKDTNVKENPKPIKGAGKGMSPIKGYNYKNWSSNYDAIFRKNKQEKDK